MNEAHRAAYGKVTFSRLVSQQGGRGGDRITYSSSENRVLRASDFKVLGEH